MKQNLVMVKRCDYCTRRVVGLKVSATSGILVICCLDCACRAVRLYCFAEQPEKLLFEKPNMRLAIDIIYSTPIE